jgi:hypothetical protein
MRPHGTTNSFSKASWKFVVSTEEALENAGLQLLCGRSTLLQEGSAKSLKILNLFAIGNKTFTFNFNV